MAVPVEVAGCRLLNKTNVRKLIDSIDTVLCDCDGVLYHSNVAVPGAADAVQILKKLGKRFFYVTNNSAKTRKEFTKKCNDLGFPAVEDDIVGSGYVTAETLKSKFKYKGKAYVLGSESLAWELSQVGVTAVGVGPDNSSLLDLESFRFDKEVNCVVVGFDAHFNYIKAAKAVTYLQNKSCLFISTNTDSALPTGSGRLLPGTGSILAMIETATQRKPDVICGKPFQPMYEILQHKYKLDPKKTLMIGDRLDTDIMFSGECGLQSLLVLSGYSTLEEVERKHDSGSVEDHQQIPMYYLPSLADLVSLLSD